MDVSWKANRSWICKWIDIHIRLMLCTTKDWLKVELFRVLVLMLTKLLMFVVKKSFTIKKTYLNFCIHLIQSWSFFKVTVNLNRIGITFNNNKFICIFDIFWILDIQCKLMYLIWKEMIYQKWLGLPTYL